MHTGEHTHTHGEQRESRVQGVTGED